MYSKAEGLSFSREQWGPTGGCKQESRLRRPEAAVRSRVGRKRVSESGPPFSAPLRIPVLGEGWREHDQGLHTQRTNGNPPSQSHRAPWVRELPGWMRKQGPRALGAVLSSATAKL